MIDRSNARVTRVIRRLLICVCILPPTHSFHNVYGPFGTWKGGREKAPAAFCRKVRACVRACVREPLGWMDGCIDTRACGLAAMVCTLT